MRLFSWVLFLFSSCVFFWLIIILGLVLFLFRIFLFFWKESIVDNCILILEWVKVNFFDLLFELLVVMLVIFILVRFFKVEVKMEVVLNDFLLVKIYIV